MASASRRSWDCWELSFGGGSAARRASRRHLPKVRVGPGCEQQTAFSVETRSFPDRGEQPLSGCALKESGSRSLVFDTGTPESISQRRRGPWGNVMAFPPPRFLTDLQELEHTVHRAGLSYGNAEAKRHAARLRSLPRGRSTERIA